MSHHLDLESLATAGLAGLAATAGSALAAGATPAFVAAPVDGFLVRSMPAFVVRVAITWLGSLGQSLNFAAAILLTAGLLGLASLVGIVAARALRRPALGVGAAGLCVLLVAAAVAGDLGSAVGAAIPAAATVAAAAWSRVEVGERASRERREVIGSLATFAGVGTLVWVLGRTRDGPGTEAAGAPLTPSGGSSRFVAPEAAMARHADAVAGRLAGAEARSLDVDGLEPLVSTDFYEVDINSINPDLDARDWSLAITGAVDRPLHFTYGDLVATEAVHEFVTLRCVGEDLNGRKMDNALWTAVPIRRLLAGVEARSGCECVMLRAADGYYEEFPLAALRRGFLAYGMNGEALPRRHGFPVRALIPGHWGEINVKWLTEIEVLEREVDGYWEERGWHGTGPVNTTAKLHVVNRLDGPDGARVEVGGHAYAGTRGIRRVEVSVDGLETWDVARLSEPLPGDDVWRQWAFEYDHPGEYHAATVRAIDGTGAVQTREWSDGYPDGATGWVAREVPP